MPFSLFWRAGREGCLPAELRKDLAKVTDKALLQRVQHVIEQVEAADGLEQISGVKKLKGTSGFYRLRLGDYRIGIAVQDDEVEFVRFLHRKDIYRYFP